MIELILLLIVNSLVCLGVFNAAFYAIEDKYPNPVKIHKGLLWVVPYLFEYKFNIKPESFWLKPIYSCLPCMASIHSTYVYWIYYNFNTFNLLQYVIYIFALSGLNLLLDKITD